MKSAQLVLGSFLIATSALAAQAKDSDYKCSIVEYVSKDRSDYTSVTPQFVVGELPSHNNEPGKTITTGTGRNRVEWGFSREGGMILVQVKKPDSDITSIFSTPEGKAVGVEVLETKNILTCNTKAALLKNKQALSVSPQAYGEYMSVVPSAYGRRVDMSLEKRVDELLNNPDFLKNLNNDQRKMLEKNKQ